MSYYRYIGPEVAQYFNTNPFYLYLRPCVFGFLNAIKQKYELAIYSRLDKKLLIFLLDIIQEEKEYFGISISHNLKDKPKALKKFYSEGRSQNNVLLLDTSPMSAAYNSDNCIPLPEFKGERLDVNLLYLQKYLLDLADEPDVSKKLRKNFYKCFLKNT